MTRPAAPTVLLVLTLAGCTRPNSAWDDPAATTSTSAATSSPTTTDASTSSSTASTAPDETGGSGTAATFTTTSVDPSTTTGAESTGIVDPSTTTTTASDSTTTDATTDGPPPPPNPEHLQLYDQDNCEEPLWCYNTNTDVFDGLGARTHSSACFTAATPPPFRLTRIGYRIIGSFGDLDDSRFEVRSYAGGPGPEIATLAAGGAALEPGPHALLTDVLINESTFCVGLVGGDTDPDAGLGVAVDSITMLPPGQSWLRIDGYGGCDLPDWVDIEDFNPTPTGTWCIDVEVVPG